METKIIKEEVSEKDFPESERISSLRSRSKGTSAQSKSVNDRSNTCKTPDSPESARLSSSVNQSSNNNNTNTNNNNPSPTASSQIQQSQQSANNVPRRSSLSPNTNNNISTNLVTNRTSHSPSPTTRPVTTVNGGALSPLDVNSSDNLVVTTTPPLSLNLDSINHAHHMNNSANHNNYLNYNPLRQLNTVKKFLCTLVQFGADIGLEIGDRVRSLVLSLVSSNLSIEEFHQALQDVTNFPLRPFVLPFLRTNLPLLQREIHTLARNAKQTPLQYVRTHDHVILDPTFSPSEASDIFLSGETPLALHRRRPSDSYFENGATTNNQTAAISSTINVSSHDAATDYTPPNKRQNLAAHHYQSNPFLVAPTSTMSHQAALFFPNLANNLSALNANLSTNPHHIDPYAPSFNNQPTQAAAINRTMPSNDSDNTESSSNLGYRNFTINSMSGSGLTRGDEEWKNIHVMLNCILSMVEKTKRALTILQQRNGQDQTTDWLRKQDIGIDLKKAANEIMAQAIRQTEDRVAEVKRKAEEAVNEVKKQAVIELQKAVQTAEAKACELVATERIKMEKMLIDARKQSTEDVGNSQSSDMHDNSQSPPIQSQVATSNQNACWNCGRKANETCSGCNLARYCGAFCQHKDWENHHSVCCQQSSLNVGKLVAMNIAGSITSSSTSSTTKHNLPAVNSSSKTGTVGTTNVLVPSTRGGDSSKLTTQRIPVDATVVNSRANTPVTSTNLNISSSRPSRDADRGSSLISK